MKKIRYLTARRGTEQMQLMLMKVVTALAAGAIVVGCATEGRHLMPTPVVYRAPAGKPVFDQAPTERRRPEVDLFYITDRAPETDPESTLPYGQEREKRIMFGSAKVRMAPDITWEALQAQSRLQRRTRDVNLEMGPVRELGRFPREPYELNQTPTGAVFRDPAGMQAHEAAKRQFADEIQRRLAYSPKKQVVLYVHGFNETFETAAYTAAELCHFLGREHVCSFFTWPASSTGNFLTSYTTTTESAQYAVDHLKKTIRMLARIPGVEGVQLLAHSRGSAVLLSAFRELMIESIAAGSEPISEMRIDNLVLFSPDIDVDIAGQQISGYVSDPDLISVWPDGRLPRVLRGRFTIYASPADRALLVSKILFRSRTRVGRLRPEDLPPEAERFIAKMEKMDLIVYEGARTDIFGHSYFTTNPQVSSDLIQMLRYGRQIGEPGRELVRTGPVTWAFANEVEAK